MGYSCYSLLRKSKISLMKKFQTIDLFPTFYLKSKYITVDAEFI